MNAPQNTEGPRQTVTIRLPQDVIDRLGFLADAERRSRSSLIELLIVEALDARDRAADEAENPTGAAITAAFFPKENDR